MISDCNHTTLTAKIESHAPADEPPYFDVRLECDDCGAMLDYEDRSVGAIIRDGSGNRLDQFEREAQDA